MATNFPNSPSNGATHTFGGTTYTYNSSKGVWKASADAIAVGDNPPSKSGKWRIMVRFKRSKNVYLLQ